MSNFLSSGIDLWVSNFSLWHTFCNVFVWLFCVGYYMIKIILRSSLLFPSSSLSSWWGSKDFKGVSDSTSWFKWWNFALWSSQFIPWWKDIGCNPWFDAAVVMCWNWKGFGHSWQSSWWYAFGSISVTLF
jgi:hypothetical protein